MKPYSIFFDLETTEANTIGQIVNFCFTAVDPNWDLIDTCCHDVYINRLQLPHPDAILTNRVDVCKHQAVAKLNEPQAMREIMRFIGSVIERAEGKVILVGYNSARFDVPYLRTSFIRNGLNPYFSGKLIYRDLLHVSRKLSIAEPEFPRIALPRGDDAEQRISLSLEVLARAFELLQGEQTHFSADDVQLTIDLAKLYHKRFGLDVRTYEAYEIDGIQDKGVVLSQKFPNYDPALQASFVTAPMMLHDLDYRNALWIDLERFKAGKGRESIRWFNKAQHQFVSDAVFESDRDLLQLAERASVELRDVTLKNFFGETDCDIEQNIYRLDFSEIDSLHARIWQGKNADLKSRDAKVVHSRYKMANYEWGSSASADKKVEQLLQKYVQYRYGGKLKTLKRKLKEGEEPKPEFFHASYNELAEALEQRLKERADSKEDVTLLESLKKYYEESDVIRVAGNLLGQGERGASV